MDKAQKAATPGRIRDYRQEEGMESRANAEEQSYAKADTEGKDKTRADQTPDTYLKPSWRGTT